MDREATEARDCPPGRNSESESVRVRRKPEAVSPQERDAADDPADHAAGRREAVPHFQDLQRPVLPQFFRMVEEQMHQVGSDDAAGNRPRRELLHRLGLESAPARLAYQEPRGEQDPRCGEDTERLQRNRPDPQRRNDEVRNHAVTAGPRTLVTIQFMLLLLGWSAEGPVPSR